jgi:hypothetical protein
MGMSRANFEGFYRRPVAGCRMVRPGASDTNQLEMGIDLSQTPGEDVNG